MGAELLELTQLLSSGSDAASIALVVYIAFMKKDLKHLANKLDDNEKVNQRDHKAIHSRITRLHKGNDDEKDS